MGKMFEAPEFFYYAIADGLRWLFVCHGRWRGLDCVREKHGDHFQNRGNDLFHASASSPTFRG